MADLPSMETLEAYRALVEAADDIVLIADWETAKFVDANRVALERLCYTLDELRQKSGRDLSLLPSELHLRLRRDLVRDGECHAPAVPILCGDGSIKALDLWVRRFHADGTSYHVNVLRDPRAEQRDETFRTARTQLLASEAFYRGVVTCTDDAVIIADFESAHCVEANPAACALFGYAPSEWHELTGRKLHAPEESATVERITRNLHARGVSRLSNLTMLRKDGTRFVADVLQNVFEAGGKRYIAGIVRDVTERLRREDELARSYAELKQAQATAMHAQKLAAVGEVAAGVAHEINNPVGYVHLNTEMIAQELERCGRLLDALDRYLAAEKDPERRRKLSEVMWHHPIDVDAVRAMLADNRDGLNRISAVTRDLRLFSRIDSEDIESVDLSDVVSSSVNLVRNELRHRAKVELELEPLPNIAVERGKLAQVLINLLLNAAHAIQEGAAESNTIRVSTRRDGDEIVLSVEDSGAGMDAKTRARAFDPFFTTKPRDQGVGLGLSLSAQIVARHGGRIEVFSRPGEGSRFEVRLPRDTGLVAKSTPPPRTRPPRASGAKRVVVIDDDAGMLRAYGRILSHHVVALFASGTDALVALEVDADRDLIICDLMMPDLDGPAVYRAIEARWPGLADRIVFCTGGAFTPRAREFIARVEPRVLDKPISSDKLEELLRAVGDGSSN